jgi:DNA-binding transcriptional ArsR family regulator
MSRNGAARFAQSSELFAALGDETRLRLVTRLSEEGPLSIARLTEGFDVTRQAVTKHLRVLYKVGLVRGARDGRENVWKLEPRRLAEARKHLDRISREWDDTLDRLHAFVEEDDAGEISKKSPPTA